MMKILKRLFIGFFTILIVFFIGIGIYIYFPSQPPVPNFDYGEWNAGSVKHILPSFDHEQLLLKISLTEPAESPLQLVVNDNIIVGKQNDPQGRFWQFYTDSLSPNTDYELQIQKNDHSKITDSWTLTTLPHPDSVPEKMTILAYTCAGGVESSIFGQEIFLDLKARQALLKRGLSFDPDVVIANGDQFYWDQKSFEISKLKKIVKKRGERQFGTLDLEQPMLSDANYEAFTSIADAQIAHLYGCYFRDKPMFFLPDDHDLLENDEALKEQNLVTLPPKDYMLDAASTTQRLYYPEFLSSALKPNDFPDYIDETKQFSTSFGSVQYGQLAEFSLYDCKRFCDLNGENAVIVPQKVENWLGNRTINSSANWLFHVPSSPFGWSAGKWHEWYPDILNEEQTALTTDIEKYLWQQGWFNQHQRILTMLSNQENRLPIILQGDLHMAAFGKIGKSGTLDFTKNPVYAVGTGPIGTGKMGYASSVRGIGANIPEGITLEELMEPLEKNGFTIIELDKDKAIFKIFAWRRPQKLEEIASLQPVYTIELKR